MEANPRKLTNSGKGLAKSKNLSTVEEKETKTRH